MIGKFNHGMPENPYNKHTWIAGKPEIGKGVWIGPFCLIDAGYAPCKIGKGTDISAGAQILTHSTVRRCLSERRYESIESAPTEIGEFCFIGTNAVVLMGAKVGHHSVIAAGAVVPQNIKIPPYSLVAGVPAKIIGSSKKFLKGIEKESISITIPAFNEEKNIEKVIKEAISEVKKIIKDYEIVLVDDGSKDKTGIIADRLAKRNKKIRVIHHKKNKGFAGAMKSCLYNATKHLVLLAPADGQFDFKELKKFVEAIRGYDMAVGYKKNTKEGYLRKFGSLAIYFLYKKLFSVGLKEFSTVSIWRRYVIESIKIESQDKSAMFMFEFFYKALNKKYKYIEVPVNWHRRLAGRAKGRGIKTILETLKGMLLLRWKMI